MNRPSTRPRRATGSHRSGACLLAGAALGLGVCGSTAAWADDINWGNINGGVFNVSTNWIGGVAPGTGDFARFGRTRPGNPQVTYTVSFSTNPSNLGLVVEDDGVTFDLNGHAHLLTSASSAITVGTTQGFTGRLTITDGSVATTAAAPNAFIGTNGMSGSLIISAGGQLLGPLLWVGAGGPGSLTIQSGGDFVGKDLLIGGFSGSPGGATITGAGSVALVDGGLGVGALSSGTLSINAGGRVESTRGVLAQNASTNGTVNLNGSGSRWTTSEEVVVGHSGQGAMNIAAGGVVECVGVTLGANAGGTGTLTVDGAGSQLNNTTTVIVGEHGAGSVSITDGGYLGTGSINIARFSGNSSVSVTGQNARLEVGYELTVGGDHTLPSNGGAGALFIGPGGIVEAAHVYICPDDLVSLHGGTLEVFRMDLLFDSTGQFLFHSGTLGARFVQFSIVNQGGTLTPRSFGETVITGSYAQQPGARLEIDVGGTDPFETAELHVSGTATLGGTLQLRLINGFVPAPDQTVVILDAAAIAGAFANVASGQRLATDDRGSSRGSFVVHYGAGSPFDPTKVVLSDFGPCPSDFNRDGFIDFFDFDAFLACFEGAGCPPGQDADFNDDGFVDFFDAGAFVEAFEAGC